jgi:C-terminal processing protease CtpA/Prc
MDAFACCSAVDMCNDVASKRTNSAGARKLREGKAGVGVVLKAKRGEDQLLIASMHPGGPAEVSGRVFEGDELLSIDGVLVQGKTYEELADLMLGSIGTSVSLGLERSGRPVEVNLMRGRADEKLASSMRVVRALNAQGQTLKTKRFPLP